MRKRQITATGKIDNVGRLNMYMEEIKDFFRQWKGRRIFARFTIVEPEGSDALRGYYYHCIVPQMQQAIWDAGERLTEEQTERRLRSLSPVMYIEQVDEQTGRYTYELKEIKDLSNAELVEHIDTIKQLAAEEYNLFIEDPRIL